MSDLDLNIDFDVGIRIAWDGDEPYAEIDAPLEVQRWIEDKLGIRGMSRLDAEVRHYVEQERIENKRPRSRGRKMMLETYFAPQSEAYVVQGMKAQRSSRWPL